MKFGTKLAGLPSLQCLATKLCTEIRMPLLREGAVHG